MCCRPNGDGLDIGSSKNIVVKNSRIDVSDSHICVRAGQGHAAALQTKPDDPVGDGRCGSHSMLFDNIVFGDGHGISFGSDGVGGVRNVTFANSFINGLGPQGSATAGYAGTAFGAVIFVKANHGGQWQDLSWRNITGVNVQKGISIAEQHSNWHSDPPWPRPLPLPLGEGSAPSGPPAFENLLFEDFDLTVRPQHGSSNFATIPHTITNLTLRRVNLRPTPDLAAKGETLGWVCEAVDCDPAGKGPDCDPPTGPEPKRPTLDKFFCTGCTAEDVEPPLVGRSGGKAYDCSFTDV